MALNVGVGQLLPDQNLAFYIDQLVLGKFHDGSQYTWLLGTSGRATVQ